jgi:hypothetical protein
MFDWNCISSEYQIEQARGSFGFWSISPSPSEKFIIRGSYGLPMPEGVDRHEYHMSVLARDLDFNNPEDRRLFSTVSPQSDVVTAPTMDLMKSFIECLHGPEAVGTWREIATAAGFAPEKYSPETFSLKANKGWISMREAHGSLSVTYEQRGRSGWWNLLGASTRDVFLPKEGDSLNSILAKFAVDHLVSWVNETQFHKPQPRVRKGQTVGVLTEMQDQVDEILKIKGRGDQRDYSNHFGFDMQKHAVELGIPADRVDAWYATAPGNMTEDDRAVLEQCRVAKKEYEKAHPYQDYWHFMLERLPDFEKDIKMRINFQTILNAAKEDWQKEIGQVYVDLFGAKDLIVDTSW